MTHLNHLIIRLRIKIEEIPADFSGFTYSKVSGNLSPSGCTKTTPDSLEITNEVLLVFKDPIDDFGFSIGATDMLSGLKYQFN